MINQKIRFFDIILSLIILIMLLPLLFFISFLVFLFDGRPIIYKQIRVGHKGRKFFIYKFRTMSNYVLKNEKLRLTSLGKILRKTSLDELPQFFNVINKDMSIVGPRPLPEIIEKKIKNPIRNKRRKILPGITGMSQINYTGKKRKLDEKLNLDLQFIDNYNLSNYFKILLKTPMVIIIRLFKNKSSIIK